jgi:hypothetical protein
VREEGGRSHQRPCDEPGAPLAAHANDDRTRGRLAAPLAALLCAVALIAPGLARANGDPASDFLLSQNVFFPFENKLSANVKQDLVAAVQRDNQAGYPVKVAIINSRSDLGLVPGMFGRPQAYAEFLGSEIGFVFQGHLLVAMPKGLGLSYKGGKPDPDRAVVGRIPVPDGPDGTGEAALNALPRLAARSGNTGGGGGGGVSTEVIAAIVATLVMVAGIVVVVLIALRRQPEGEDADEPPSPTSA